MWKEIVENKHKFIGGKLQDLDEDFGEAEETIIIDIKLTENLFEVIGESYICMINTKYGGLRGTKSGWFEISGPMTNWKFKPREDA